MGERLVVVGGNAAGMSAASQAKRLRPDLTVIALERGEHVSYGTCGVPYWIGGEVDGPDALVARTAEEHRANEIDVRLRTEAVALDLEGRTVTARDVSGRTETFDYDHLLLATGANPVRPPLPGIDSAGVLGVQTLDDGAAVLAWLDELDGSGDSADRGTRRRAVIVGAGYIGVEMAEALTRRGLAVTVVERAPEPLSGLDPELGAQLHSAMEDIGIDVRTGTAVEAIEADDAGRVAAVRTGAGRLPADVVVLGIGVRPATGLAAEAGLPLGPTGGIRTDRRMQVLDRPGVWAAGDCVEVLHRVSGRPAHVALGTHANKQGRVVGTNVGGGYATFPGVLGTAIVKVCALEVARTGLGEHEARQAGFEVDVASLDTTTRAGYYPGAEPMTIKAVAERRTGRLLGVQIIGREGAAKRIDTAAVAIWNEMPVAEVAGLDLAYAPPFGSVWDPVQLVARRLAESAAR